MGRWGRILLTVALVGYGLGPHSATGEEIVIEDRIGDVASTDGNYELQSVVPVGWVTVSKFFSASSVRLTRIEVVGATSRWDSELKRDVSVPPFGAIQNMYIAIHSTEEHSRLGPTLGDVAYSLGWGAGGATGMEEPVLRFVPLEVTNSYGIQSYLFSLELKLDMFPEVRLAAGTPYWFTLFSELNGGWVDFPESALPGESDVWMAHNGSAYEFLCSYTSCFDFPYETGRMAFKLIGETLGPSGDYDQDGDADGADFLMWQREFGATRLAYKGADGNGNGIVDAADYVVWRDSYGAGGSAASQLGVPEPGTFAMLMVSLGLLSGRRRFICR